jgi:hypothetical protein
MTSEPDLAFRGSVFGRQAPASLNSLFAVFRVKSRLEAPAHSFGWRQACVIVPSLVEKFHRSIWPGKPCQRWNDVDSANQIFLGLIQLVGAVNSLGELALCDKFRLLDAVF